MKNASPIPFEKFMERALHDPAHGYYARRISGIGRHGDFTTAPMLSDAPARAIAAWAAAAMKETGCRNMIEAGPGEGLLAARVLACLPWHVRWKTRLHLVETSAPLAARQRELLGRRAIHHRSMAEALAASNGAAVIYSNELVDAFPVRRFRKTESGWQEIAVHFDPGGQPVESLLAGAPLPDSTVFGITCPDGQTVEIHDSYHRHLTAWMPEWKRGRMLTIDYGGTAENLYHRRPRGSIRGYLFQQLIEGMAIYDNPGRQDLTADVNFSDLIRWSQPWTSDSILCSFGAFLKNAAQSGNPHDVPLLDEAGAGGAFLVLDQKR